MKMSELDTKYQPQSNSGFLKLEKGKKYVLRVVSELFPLQKAPFRESPAKVVFICRVIDRADGKLKIFEMGNQVYSQYLSYAKDPDYAFEDVPAFELKITAESTGPLAQNVKYVAQPGIPGKVTLTSEEKEEISKASDIKEFVAKLQEKEQAKMSNIVGDQGPIQDEQPTNTINPEDIPF